MAITDTRIRNAKPSEKPFKLIDSHGLHIEVRPSGAKLWRYRFRIDGNETMCALGSYPEVSLADARAARDEARKLVRQGKNPAHHRRALRAAQISENANSFEAIAREWVAQHQAKWTPYYLRQVEAFMGADVFPYIGALPIRSVTAAHLLEIIKRVEKRAPTVALLIRQWCSAVFRYAVATLRADADPAAALKGALSRPRVEHRKPLQREDIPSFFKSLQKSGSFPATSIAMRLLMLTFVRPVELRAAEWSEFDLKHAEWRIPAAKMKMRTEHIVPLSTQAIGLLQELKTITGGSRFLFPNHRRPKTFMADATLNRTLERMGYGGKFSAHGFRATASTMLNEMGFSPDWIERQLAHKERNQVRAAYNQAQYLDERRRMVQTWADLLENLSKGGKVIPGRFGTAA
jgi:integrase